MTGHKETQGKLSYELSWDFITKMAERMSLNKDKYEPYNWQKPIDVLEIKKALTRHLMEIHADRYDDEQQLGHVIAMGCNAMILYHQLMFNKMSQEGVDKITNHWDEKVLELTAQLALKEAENTKLRNEIEKLYKYGLFPNGVAPVKPINVDVVDGTTKTDPFRQIILTGVADKTATAKYNQNISTNPSYIYESYSTSTTLPTNSEGHE